MDAYIEAQMMIVRPMHAERRAEAKANRLVAYRYHRAHATALGHRKERAGWLKRLADAATRSHARTARP